MIKQHKAETDEIMDVMFAMEQEFEERQSDAKQEFQSLRDEIKNKVIIMIYYWKPFFLDPCCFCVENPNWKQIRLYMLRFQYYPFVFWYTVKLFVVTITYIADQVKEMRQA